MATIKKRIRLIVLLCGAMIGVFIIDLFLGGDLKAFGVYPRDLQRLPFILTAPFIHGSWQHLINNLPGCHIELSLYGEIHSILPLGKPVYYPGDRIVIVAIWSALYPYRRKWLDIWSMGAVSFSGFFYPKFSQCCHCFIGSDFLWRNGFWHVPSR